MPTAIQEMSDKELAGYLDDARREIFSLRCNYAVARSLQRPSRVGQLRRNIARALTIQRERELLRVKNEDERVSETIKPVQIKESRKKTKREKSSKKTKR